MTTDWLISDGSGWVCVLAKVRGMVRVFVCEKDEVRVQMCVCVSDGVSCEKDGVRA